MLGGGLSNIAKLYDELPARIATYAFSDAIDTPIMRARHWGLQRSARCRVALAGRVTNGDGLPGAFVLKHRSSVLAGINSLDV